MTGTAADGFGSTLKRWRLAAGLTQEALAQRAGISARAVSDLERDPTRTPRLDTVGLLADALRLQPAQRSDLLGAARRLSPARGQEVLVGIPRPLTALIGRTGTTADLVGLIRRSETRLLTLTGTGGVGKTRLALEVAAEVAADFPDGAVFVDLAPLRDPDLVRPAVARAFGLGEHDAVPVHERLAAVLRGKRALLVLDNFEHLLPARAGLLDLLTACPAIVALVTSRVALRLRGERDYRVDPLPTSTLVDVARSPAADLLTERARAIGVELTAGDEPAIAEICHRLEGLPLAIELAAARLRLLSPDDLARRLEPSLPMLTMGADDLPHRQRTMRDAIAWSYQLLPEHHRTLFRTLTVFAGGWTLAAAEAVCASHTLPEDLAALVDASLVRRDRPGPTVRFAMMETLREFGCDQLAAGGEADGTARRHADYFAALAESEPAALTRELDNLRAALRWALDSRCAQIAVRMCAALAPFWSEHGHLSEGLGWTQAALALHAADIPAPTRIAALTGAATMAITLSAFDEATTLCASLVPFARQAGSAQDLIAALNTRGLLARMQDRYRDAIADYQDALAHAEHAGDAGGRAKALIGLSDVTFFTGDTAHAYELAQLGLAATRAAGNDGDLADALLSFVRQTMHAGDFARTDTLGTEALQIRRTHNDIRNQAEALRALGTSATLQQQYERAAHLLEQALALYRNSGDERVAPQLLAHLGQVALDTGDFARAEQLCAESLDVAHRFDDRWAIAMSTTLLGHVDLAMGRVEPAGLRFRDSAEVFEAIGNPLFLSWCLEGAAGVATARGHYTAAARLCAARDELLSDLSAAIPPAHPDGYRQTLATVDAELGAEWVTAARESVRGVPPVDVIAAEE